MNWVSFPAQQVRNDPQVQRQRKLRLGSAVLGAGQSEKEMSTTIQIHSTLETIECHSCGILFAMPERTLRECRDNGREFFCPNGHSAVFLKSEVQRLKEALEEKSKLLIKAQCEVAKQKQIVDELETKAARVKNGVCPCCNRTFQNLMRHMKSKHPEAAKK